MKSSKTSKAMLSSLREISRRGGLEPEQMEMLETLVRRVDHAVAVADRRAMRKAWDALARELCRAFIVRGE